MDCDEANKYFPNSVNQCTLCDYPGCFSCLDDKCLDCDEANKYNFNGTGQCELCEQVGCL